MATIEMHDSAHWLHIFAMRFTHFFNHRDASPTSFALQVHHQFAKSEPQDEGERFFFNVYLQAYILKTLIEQSPQRKGQPRWFQDCEAAKQQCTEKMKVVFALLPALLQGLGHSVRNSDAQKKFRKLLADCLRFFEEQILKGESHHFWLIGYTEALLALRTEPALLNAESAHLNRIEDLKFSELMQLALCFALAQDDQVIARYEEGNETSRMSPSDRSVLHMLECLRREHDWDRLHRWLQHMPVQAETFNEKEIRILLEHWLSLPASKMAEIEIEQVFSRMHPWSHAEYSKFLMDRGRYDDWYTLYVQLLHQQSHLIAEVPPEIFRHRPDLVIVMHHQWIDNALANRSSKHEEVINRLKYLRTCYVDMQRSDEWRHFIDCLQHKYKRSRAFIRLIEGADLHA